MAAFHHVDVYKRQAQSNRDVTESKLRQETMNFNQNLFILVEQFNNQQAQLQICLLYTSALHNE